MPLLTTGAGAYPAIGGGGTPFSITQTATASTTTGSTPVVFAGLSIGAADTTRIVAVSICHGPNNGTFTSLTIGGVTATLATGSKQNSTGGVSAEIWYAAVPTGTTATVQYDQLAGVDTRHFISVYRIAGTTASFSAGGGAASLSVTSLAASVSIPVGGGALAGCMTHSATSGSGTPTNLTLDTNNVVVGTSTSYVGNNSTNSGSTSMGVAWTGGTDAALTIATFTA